LKFECPKGWKSVVKIGSVTLESATVNISNGVCDSADLCGIESCEFYDTSIEATQEFFRGQKKEQTLEYLLEPIN
jgi:hypothetical protein